MGGAFRSHTDRSMTIKTKQGGIFMNFDWIKTRADFDVEKPAVIDPFKGTQ